MRILVLGATGFIGGQVVRAGIEAGLEVHGLRRQANSVGAVGDLPVVWQQGNLTDHDSLEAAMQGCKVVIHAAGYAPQEDRGMRYALQTGTDEMRRVLSAAKNSGVERVVYTSSLTTIGPPSDVDRLADERDGYVPGSTGNNYYEVKWAMEHEALRANQGGLPVIILCPTAAFGPGDVKPSTSQLLLMLAKGQMPVSVDAETNIVDGREVGLAHIRAIESGDSGERYIVGGHNMNVDDALRQAAAVIGVREPGSTLSTRTIAGLLRVGDVLRLPIPATIRGIPYWQGLNCQRGWETFDINPRPFEETVQDTVAWFREHGYL